MRGGDTPLRLRLRAPVGVDRRQARPPRGSPRARRRTRDRSRGGRAGGRRLARATAAEPTTLTSHSRSPCRYAVWTTASTPSTASASAASSRTSTRTQSRVRRRRPLEPRRAHVPPVRRRPSDELAAEVPAPTGDHQPLHSRHIVTETPTDSWPTVETHPRRAAALAPPPPPPPPEPDRRFGVGMLLALAAIALAVAGVAIAYFLTHRDNGPNVTTRRHDLRHRRGRQDDAEADRRDARRGEGDARDVRHPPGRHVADEQAAGGDGPRPGARGRRDAHAQDAGDARRRAGRERRRPPRPATTSTEATTTAADHDRLRPAAAEHRDRAGRLEPDGGSSRAVAEPRRDPREPRLRPGSDPLGTVEGQAKQAGTTVPYHSHMQINISSGPGDKPRSRCRT